MTKHDLQNFVSQLPDGDFSVEDLHYRLRLFAEIQEGRRQIDSGQVHTMEEIEQESELWLSE